MTTENNTEQNSIRNLLIDLGICDPSSITQYYPKVRDRDDVAVLKCNKSGVIFLSRSSHMDISNYQNKEGFTYWSADDRKQVVNEGLEDNIRRKELLQNLVANRKWLDIGTGAGGILDEVSSLASKAAAIEPQNAVREILIKEGYNVYKDIDSIDESDFEVVTLFHVFEHFTNPLEDLKSIHKTMAAEGKIIIEVPHANDFLISFLDNESFKKFTFWSEHLILHTRRSLERFLQKAGFKDIIINGCQRYPLANHLHWLTMNQPGGHQKWSFLRTAELDNAYSQMLASLDKTDTLIATATK